MSNFRQEFVDPIENAVNALTPGFAAMGGGLGPPVRPTPPPALAAAGGLGPPVRPTPPPPPSWLTEYQPLIQFVDYYCGLADSGARRHWPDPGPLLRSNASAQVRATGLLLASAFLRRNAAREWISADHVATLLDDAAARLSAHAQSLLG
ncbi:MAG TPA: hypothetical protein VN720_00045 [Rudaea sp.]|nr:hypothetical protein [Rudaea sp.]